MREVIGAQLDRYRVVSLLGAGGMGTVYRAWDPDLEREVALKVLPDVGADDPVRIERFNREIRTVARLSHPNIVELYDFGRADECSYAVMEMLRGHNLRHHLHGRPMPLDRVLAIGCAVATGLGAAHRQGVLHRDIKPENIFVTSTGQTKILDFGLARDLTGAAVHPDADTHSARGTLTLPGTVLGTTSYMSPEQVRGQALDSRSDIFSLGCVLYEMLSGANPFLRETHADTMSAVLHHGPPRLTEDRPGLPPALDLIVARCLEKKPEDRFESALDVAFAIQALSESRAGRQADAHATVSLRRGLLGWVGGVGAAVLVAALGFLVLDRLSPAPLPDPRHLAVVRFEADGGGPDLGQLADGLTETVAAGISEVAEQTRGVVWAVPREVMRAASLDSVEAMRRRYAVGVGVRGRLRQWGGGGLQLDLEVLDAGTGERIREATIGDSLDNPRSFQEEPVLRLAEMLELQVEPGTRARLSARGTNHAVAFSSYLRAVGLLYPAYEQGDGTTAEGLLLEAIASDPGFAPAREALASLYLRRFEASRDPTWIGEGLSAVDEVMRRSPTAAASLLAARLRRAQGQHSEAADLLAAAARSFPDSGELQIELGQACEAAGRVLEAERAYERAINLRPGYWVGHHRLAMLEWVRGRYDGAANSWRAAVACAPEHDGGYANLGMAYNQLDRPDDARVMYERALELGGGNDDRILSNLGTLYFELSRFAEAAELFERALAVNDQRYAVWGNLGEAYAASLDPEKADRPFRRAVELAGKELARGGEDPQLLSSLGSYHAMLGEREASIRFLEEAIALAPTDPTVLAVIGESFEDLGDRARALEWVGRALAGGVPRSRFECRPSLRGLVDDPRFQSMASDRPTITP